jgi:hypothetical protein
MVAAAIEEIGAAGCRFPQEIVQDRASIKPDGIAGRFGL